MSNHRPNKFSGTCTCGTKVAAGAGLLGSKVNGRWTTVCWPCQNLRSGSKDVGSWTGEACDAVRDARFAW